MLGARRKLSEVQVNAFMRAKFVAYTPDGGYELFDTQRDAVAHVTAYIEAAREQAGNDGYWPLDTDEAWWGRIVERVEEVNKRLALCEYCECETGHPHDPECDDYDQAFPNAQFLGDPDYTCDYALVPVEAP